MPADRRSPRSFLPLALVVLAVACGGGEPAADTTTPAADPGPSADSISMISGTDTPGAAREDPTAAATAEDSAAIARDRALEAARASRPAVIPRDPFLLGRVPLDIRDALTQRNCTVPQVAGDTTINTVTGSLFGPNTVGWAIVCDRPGATQILVFRDRSPVIVAELRRLSAGEPCGGEIAPVAATDLVARVRAGRLAGPDTSAVLTPAERSLYVHDGVLDTTCDGRAVVHYWAGERWVELSKEPGA